MRLHPKTQEFLRYLHNNPSIRSQIRAAPDKTLLYAGSFTMPMWKEILQTRARRPELADKQILIDVLARIRAPDTRHMHLLAYVEEVEKTVTKEGCSDNTQVIWRTLSGIFAANAEGAVSFQVGQDVTADKVFATTEVNVLMRNPKVDSLTKDVLGYYKRCLDQKQTAVNFGLIRA
jgi:hypothetical protein